MSARLPCTRTGLGFVTAFTVTLCGGMLMGAAEIFPLPLAIDFAGLGLFAAGTLLIAGLAVMVSRATGKSVAGSAWSGARVAFRWIWLFLP